MWLFDKIKNIKQRIMLRRIDVLEEDILGALNISDNSQNTLYREPEITEEDILGALNISDNSQNTLYRETEITEEDILGALQESTNQSTYLRTINNGETSNGSIQQRRNVPPTSKTNSGRNYAISDIHGMYGSYMEAVRNLKENDTLYVIGDVVDRGENGIKILLDMMSRKNVKFILGNHEWQMIQVLKLIREHHLTGEAIDKYVEAGWAAYYEAINDNKKQIALGFRKRKDEIVTEIKNNLLIQNDVLLSDKDMILMYAWIDYNHGIVTLDEYLKLPKQQQDEVYRYLTTAYVMLKKTIGQQQHCLVHASPPEADFLIEVFEKKPEGGIKYNELVEHEDERFSEAFLSICTQTRDTNEGFEFWSEHGYKTVYGHTPSRGQIVINQEDNAVCIDAACSMGGKLALYCLEDGKVKYINPRENYSDMEFDNR